MTELRPGWLRRQLDEAAREVASWPEWKRQLVKKCFNAPTNPEMDVSLSAPLPRGPELQRKGVRRCRMDYNAHGLAGLQVTKQVHRKDGR